MLLGVAVTCIEPVGFFISSLKEKKRMYGGKYVWKVWLHIHQQESIDVHRGQVKNSMHYFWLKIPRRHRCVIGRLTHADPMDIINHLHVWNYMWIWEMGGEICQTEVLSMAESTHTTITQKKKKKKRKRKGGRKGKGRNVNVHILAFIYECLWLSLSLHFSPPLSHSLSESVCVKVGWLSLFFLWWWSKAGRLGLVQTFFVADTKGRKDSSLLLFTLLAKNREEGRKYSR